MWGKSLVFLVHVIPLFTQLHYTPPKSDSSLPETAQFLSNAKATDSTFTQVFAIGVKNYEGLYLKRKAALSITKLLSKYNGYIWAMKMQCPGRCQKFGLLFTRKGMQFFVAAIKCCFIFIQQLTKAQSNYGGCNLYKRNFQHFSHRRVLKFLIPNTAKSPPYD